MATLSDMISKVELVLSSAGESAENVTDLIFDGIVAAHEAILPWLPKTAITEITSGSSGMDFLLPADVYLVDGVYDASNDKMLPKLDLSPGVVFKDSTDVAKWFDMPIGYIRLNRSVDEDTIGVIYRATWNVPDNASDSNFVIEVPRFAHTALVIYAAAYVGFILAGSTADLRQYGNQTQSGNPEHNPLLTWSNRLLKRFMEEVSSFPPLNRVVKS